MGDVLSCTKISSTTRTLKPIPKKVIINSNNSALTQRTVTPRYNSSNDFGSEATTQQTRQLQQLQAQNDELLSNVIHFRQQLEVLKGLLEDKDRMDAEKDEIIQSLTTALRAAQIATSVNSSTVHQQGSEIGDRNHNYNNHHFDSFSPTLLKTTRKADGNPGYYDDELV